MQNLFAPWRMEYIKAEAEPGCLFCRVWDEPPERDQANLVLWRLPRVLVMMNKFPYNNGHLMLAPRSHVGGLTDLVDGDAAALMVGVQLSLRALEAALGPDGFNVGANLGRIAGAGIPDHVHLHVVPRWSGDTNFMPVLGEVKVVNEHLERSWEKLRPAFAELVAGPLAEGS